MSDKITKISKLKNLETFIQINYLKGFKYIDKVGEILNLYQKESGAIAYDMSPDRLIIPKPTPQITEIKISNVDFWYHNNEPTNLGEVARIFINEAKNVLSIISPKEATRIGWRNYYVYELKSKQTNINSLSKINKAAIQEISLQKDLNDDVKATVRIKLLKKKETEEIVLFIDLDVYLDIKKSLSEAYQLLNNLKSSIESKEILDLVNEIIRNIERQK